MKYKNTDKNQDSKSLDLYCPDDAFFSLQSCTSISTAEPAERSGMQFHKVV